MADSVPMLDLRQLGEEPGLPALTAVAGRFLGESAAVCLENQGHTPGVSLTLTGLNLSLCQLEWPDVTPQMRRTFNDLQEATENGAYGVALLLICTSLGFTVIERSRKGTGFDYWLGDREPLPFQNKARLEVSGILCGTEPQIAARIRQKRQQLRRSDQTRLPGYIVVVEFGRPRAAVSER